MRISLGSPARKVYLLAAALLVAALYLSLALRDWLAARFATQPALDRLQAAVRLQPSNADYHYRLGRYLSLVTHDPPAALEQYKAAVDLNPYAARYWLELATAYQVLGNLEQQRQSLERAIQADPTTPDVAWEAANMYLVRGETEKAFREFRVVVENDPYLPGAALQLCWRARPEVETILRQVLPPRADAYLAFLDLQVAKKNTAGAARVWNGLARLGQPFEARRMFDYFRYLIREKEIEQARLVWQQASRLCGLSAYLPSPENLVVNSSFTADLLNEGFDWHYVAEPHVHLTLDPREFHRGQRSLAIVFDGQGVNDAGIFQLIPVQPGSRYEFSASFKTENLEGAGGPHLVLLDAYTEAVCLLSAELRDAEFWKPVRGEFTAGPDTRLIALRVRRLPAGSPIRGKLWLDDLRLAPKQP